MIEIADSATHMHLEVRVYRELQGNSVNVKWYAKQEGMLDMCLHSEPDYYLVLAGPTAQPIKTMGPRPWLIESVYLFNHAELKAVISAKIGIATSIRKKYWAQYQIYPAAHNDLLILTEMQRQQLALFSSGKGK